MIGNFLAILAGAGLGALLRYAYSKTLSEEELWEEFCGR